MTDDEFEGLKKMMEETGGKVELDGQVVRNMEIEPIEFLYNGQVIKMAGTRIVRYEDGSEFRYPISYDSLVATLQHVPVQFGPPEPPQS